VKLFWLSYSFLPRTALFWLKIFSIFVFFRVVDTGGAPWAANISANFRKNLKRP
jgi:hypothetical protein